MGWSVLVCRFAFADLGTQDEAVAGHDPLAGDNAEEDLDRLIALVETP